ncbi:Mitochondrial outer membrane protein iml2 [Arthrobotrys musiformis]|uniref:Mitochondrial outer membrane protein iml2 n=1 Tax=Arthrobotrys musiformis TaxID=47236 RepID=A0AAV9VQS0_9PEZI
MDGEKHTAEKITPAGPVNSDVTHASKEVEASLLKRVGFVTTFITCVSFAVLIACVVFLSWLWYSNIDNSTWHRIMINEWATRAVSLTSTVLRWAVATQTALGLAMLAAVSLERFDVPLANVASVSLMRVNGGELVPTLLDVCWPLSRFGPPGVIFRTVLPILSLLATATLVQFTSTALLSDLHTDAIPGFPMHSNISIDWFWDGIRYRYIPPASSEVIWAGNTPAFWPAFAELSGAPFKHEGVVDTGMNVRAFLPYSAAEARQSLHTYKGKAFLIDSRVTCQRPVLDDLVIYTTSPDGVWGGTQQPALSGTVSPSVDTPRLNASDHPIAFDCPYSRQSTGKFSICELHNVRVRYPADPSYEYAGTLVSEFRPFPPASPAQNASGAAYIIMAVDNAEVQVSNGEWTTVDVTVPGDGENPTDTNTHNITATLCFTSLDTVRRNVEIYSNSNRTEPELSWNGTTENFNWTSVWNQLLAGSKNPLSTEERGVLNLRPPADTWVAPESLEPGYDGPMSNTRVGSIWDRSRPYIRDNLHLQRPGSYPYGNYSAILDEWAWGWIEDYGGWPQVQAKRWIVNLFERMVLENGTVADALHMILFSLAAVAYYDQLPQYDVWTEVNTVTFVSVLHPGGPFGATRTELPIGFIIVMVVLAFHVLSFSLVCWIFAFKSKFSRLGDTWMAIANVADATITQGILEAARKVTGSRSDSTRDDQNLNVGLVVVDGQVHLKTV